MSPGSPMVAEEAPGVMAQLVPPPPMVETEDQHQPAVSEKKGGFKMPGKVNFQAPSMSSAVSPASSPTSSSKGSKSKGGKKNAGVKSHSTVTKSVKAPKKEKDPNAPKKPSR